MKLERKIMVVGLVFLLTTMGVFWSVTSDIVFDTSSGVDNINTYTKIMCSNGNVYEPTFANLQTAVNLSGVSEVMVPACNITFTDTLWIPSGVWLHGVGNGTVFFLGDNVNKTMIKPPGYDLYYPTGESNNIRFSDFVLDGNGLNQPKYQPGSSIDITNCMSLVFCNNTVIENIVFRNAAFVGLNYKHSRNITIDKCFFSNCGMQKEGWMDGTFDKWQNGGLQLNSCHNFTVSNCQFNTMYNFGIAVESTYLYGVSQPGSTNWAITNCIVDTCYAGYWFENSNNGLLSNSITRNATRQNVYIIQPGQNAGVNIHSGTHHITVSNCKFTVIGGTDGDYKYNGEGIHLTGENNTVIGCTVDIINGNGTKVQGIHNILSNTRISNTYKYGIYIAGGTSNIFGDMKIIDNIVLNPGDTGIYIQHTVGGYRERQVGVLIDGNTIISEQTTGGISCIRNRMFNVTISDNTCYGGYYGIYSEGTYCLITNNHIENTANDGIFQTGVATLKSGNNTIMMNHIYRPGDDGISINFNFSIVSMNMIYDAVDDGIVIQANVNNCSFFGNIITVADVGILESAGANWNMVNYNNALSCTTPFDLDGAKTIAHAGTTNFGAVS